MVIPTAQPTGSSRTSMVWQILASVSDPELPILSIIDLGIVRDVQTQNESIEVHLSPTYTGCPATEVIAENVIHALNAHGIDDVIIKQVLSPPWSSDWISEEGRRKLMAFGIAPPQQRVARVKHLLLDGEPAVSCPRCHSNNTQKVSEFGSTPCKAHYRCSQCLEPFDYFKCI